MLNLNQIVVDLHRDNLVLEMIDPVLSDRVVNADYVKILLTLLKSGQY